jgi:hypothetical protein
VFDCLLLLYLLDYNTTGRLCFIKSIYVTRKHCNSEVGLMYLLAILRFLKL